MGPDSEGETLVSTRHSSRQFPLRPYSPDQLVAQIPQRAHERHAVPVTRAPCAGRDGAARTGIASSGPPTHRAVPLPPAATGTRDMRFSVPSAVEGM